MDDSDPDHDQKRKIAMRLQGGGYRVTRKETGRPRREESNDSCESHCCDSPSKDPVIELAEVSWLSQDRSLLSPADEIHQVRKGIAVVPGIRNHR